MNVADLIMALRVRWKLQLAIAFTILVAVGAWTWLSPRVYVATASLLFDESAPDPLAKEQQAPLIGTQADIIRSEILASQVVRSQNLLRSGNMMTRWRQATGGVGSPEAWLGRTLLGNLEVVPGKNSNVLGVVYRSNDANFAALMANAFASAYVEARLQFQIDPAKTYAHWYQERTSEERAKLEKAQNALAAFRRENGIVDDGSINAENIRLSELSRLLTTAEADAAQARAGTGMTSSAVQDSGTVQMLRSEIARKTADLSQARTVYGPNHPSIVSANAELAELRSKMASAAGIASAAQRVGSGSVIAREGDLRAEMAGQRARMLKLIDNRSQVEVLQRDVDSARAAFDTVTQRLSSMRLQSELPRANVRQLDEARPPTFPAEPNIPLRLFLGLLVGVMTAVTAGLALEWHRPMVRTSGGLEAQTGIPIAALVPLGDSAVMRLLGRGAVA